MYKIAIANKVSNLKYVYQPGVNPMNGTANPQHYNGLAVIDFFSSKKMSYLRNVPAAAKKQVESINIIISTIEKTEKISNESEEPEIFSEVIFIDFYSILESLNKYSTEATSVNSTDPLIIKSLELINRCDLIKKFNE